MLGGHLSSKYRAAYSFLSMCVVMGFLFCFGSFPCLPCLGGMVAKCVLSFQIKMTFLVTDKQAAALIPETLIL